jgi:hypothetical protein
MKTIFSKISPFVIDGNPYLILILYYDPKGAYIWINVYDMTPRGEYMGLNVHVMRKYICNMVILVIKGPYVQV